MAPRAHVHGGATHLTYTCEQMLHRNCAAINEGSYGSDSEVEGPVGVRPLYPTKQPD